MSGKHRSNETAAAKPAPPRPAFAGRTRSPCISVCRIDPDDGRCVGCQRTIDEIASWGAMTPEQRVEVWRLIAERREAKAAEARTAKTGAAAREPAPERERR